MMAASTYLPSITSRTMAASSIQGTGAQNLADRSAQGMFGRVRHRIGADFRESLTRFIA
jgi:hypothetical protein